MKQVNERAREQHPGTIIIIGIGQSLRGDDAAGLAAVRLWEKTYHVNNPQSNIRVEIAELPGIGLLNLFKGAEAAILVDAMHSGSQIGTVSIVAESQIEAFINESGSAHGWGVAETLSLGRKLMPTAIPGKLFLIGIEAGQVNPGEALSNEVEAALPEAARLIEQCVSQVSQDEEGYSKSPRFSPR